VTMKIMFHALAEEELFDAAAYYESCSCGLGKAFLDKAEKAAALIVKYPEAAPVVRGKVRAIAVEPFPYRLLYAVTGNNVFIVAVAHQHRRPFYWSKRTVSKAEYPMKQDRSSGLHLSEPKEQFLVKATKRKRK